MGIKVKVFRNVLAYALVVMLALGLMWTPGMTVYAESGDEGLNAGDPSVITGDPSGIEDEAAQSDPGGGTASGDQGSGGGAVSSETDGVTTAADPGLTAFGNPGDYNTGDVMVINNIITTNGLDWTPAPDDGSSVPSDWTGVTWSGVTTNKRITYLNIDYKNLTGNLNVSGLTELQTLYCNGNGLTSLTLSNLPVLRTLGCNGNGLTSLDVTSFTSLTTLNCSHNELPSLDVSGLTALKTLYCHYNKLTSLNLSGLSALQTLSCNDNKLPSLNVSGLTALQELNCSYNKLTSLNVSGHTSLVYLKCSNNALTSLDASVLTNLEELNCNYNKLTSLKVSGLAALQTLYCYNNALTSLNISGCISLDSLNLGGNRITSLDLSDSRNIRVLSCYNNNISALDISGLTQLSTLSCYSNKLTSLDLTGLSNLSFIVCDSNNLASLDLSGKTALRSLYCSDNKLTSLELSGCPGLQWLSCQNNALTSLDARGLSSLTNLSCSNNKLVSLDVSGQAQLRYLSCYNNKLTSLNVSGCAGLLDINCEDNALAALSIAGLSGLESLYCGGNELTSLITTGCTNLRSINCYGNKFTSLNLSGLPALKYLSCGNNDFTTLNMSGMATLESLYCQEGKITSLNLSGCTGLLGLNCEDNLLTSLDVSDCTGLLELYCSFNSLTSLDVSDMASLEWLYCYGNRISALNVSGCTNLIEIDCWGNELASLDLSLPSLESLWCGENRLSSLEVTDCTALRWLDCSENELTSLDVTGLTKLVGLWCQMNYMPDKSAVTGLLGNPNFFRWSSAAAGEEDTFVFDPQKKASLPHIAIGIAPAHVILSDALDSGVFEVSSKTSGITYSKVAWSVDGLVQDGAGDWCLPVPPVTPGNPATPGVKVLSVTLKDGGKKAEVKALETDTARTLRVRAVYDGLYSATATVEILPEGITSGAVTERAVFKVLENKVTINKAKKAGVKVPIHITKQNPSDYGLSAFGDPGFGAFADPAPGTLKIADIRLTVVNTLGVKVDLNDPVSATAGWYTVDKHDPDDRYIEISATMDAKNINKVRVEIKPVGSTEWIPATSTIDLAVVEQYPAIKFTHDDLNLFFSGTAATPALPEGELKAEASDGSKVTIKKVLHNVRDNGFVDLAASNSGTDSHKWPLAAKKKGKQSLSVELEIEGYYQATKGNKPLVTNVSVTETIPKLKLDKASVSLADSAYTANNKVGIKLLSNAKNIPFESNYKVKGVACVSSNTGKNTVLGAEYKGDGKIDIWLLTGAAATRGGTAVLRVSFEGTDRTVDLNLKVSIVKEKDLKATAKPNSAIVNVSQDYNNNNFARFDITVNAANTAWGWQIEDYTVGTSKVKIPYEDSDLKKAISYGYNSSLMVLYVNDNDALKKLRLNGNDTKYTLNIVSRNYSVPCKPCSITLNITSNAPSFNISLGKAGIDIANPDSFQTATVKLNNVTSGISSVWVFDSTIDALAGKESKDFYVGSISGNTFTVKALNDKLVPGLTKKLSVEIRLWNGQMLKSWGPDKYGVIKDKPINITPKQTIGKKWQSKSAVTLYKAVPLAGEDIELGLTTPQNVTLGFAQINEASLKAMNFKEGGFELSQNGHGVWTIHFKDGKAPVPKKGNLSPSYNLKLELWAEGTYDTEVKDGNTIAVPLKAGAKQSKPTYVTVKVFIK